MTARALQLNYLPKSSDPQSLFGCGWKSGGGQNIENGWKGEKIEDILVFLYDFKLGWYKSGEIDDSFVWLRIKKR